MCFLEYTFLNSLFYFIKKKYLKKDFKTFNRYFIDFFW